MPRLPRPRHFWAILPSLVSQVGLANRDWPSLPDPTDSQLFRIAGAQRDAPIQVSAASGGGFGVPPECRDNLLSAPVADARAGFLSPALGFCSLWISHRMQAGEGVLARSFGGDICLGERRTKSEPKVILFEEFPEYHQAKVLAFNIGKRDGLHEDVVFSDAMHVAVAIALEDEKMPYTSSNVAWMFSRILPEEVRNLLLLRWNHPGDYRNLSMAGVMEGLSSAEIEAATDLANKLTLEQLDAFFFSDRVGNA
jgi:hypothetical protein